MQIPMPDSPAFMQYWQHMTEKYPRCRRAWLGPFFCSVLCTHPDTVKVIMKSSEPKLTDYTAAYSLILPWLGELCFKFWILDFVIT